MKALRALALAGTLAAATLPAAAIQGDWGTHDLAEVAAQIASPGMINDSFLFSVGAGTTLSATAVSNNLQPVFNLANGFVQLFRSEAGPDTMLDMFAFNGTTGSIAHTFSSLAAGDYYYLVTGMASGSAGAVYTLTSTNVSVVPEPGALSLFVAGLIASGIVLRRRRPV